MGPNLLKLTTILAAMTVGMSAPVLAQTSGQTPAPGAAAETEMQAPSTKPSEAPADATATAELREGCDEGMIRETVDGDCMPEAMVGTTGAVVDGVVVTDPNADATSNPSETGEDETATEELKN